MPELTIQWAPPSAPYEEAKKIREDVFVQEQGFSETSEFDEADLCCWHVVLSVENRPAATGRILQDEAGRWHLGRIAVRKAYRKNGLGAALVHEMILKAKELGADEIVLGAQCRAKGFYEKLGFVVCGQEYMDEHVPHVEMKLVSQ